MKNKQKNINEQIFKELKVNKILNQINYAIAGLKYNVSKDIIYAMLKNKKVSIEIRIENKLAKVYEFRQIDN